MQDEIPQLTYAFTDVMALKRAYMPFVRDGGIFIPTEKVFHLGNLITATITLPTNKQTFTFTGEIIWITPVKMERAGVGIHCFSEEGSAFQKAVQQLITELHDDTEESETL